MAEIQRIGVIGAGTMGSGIAQVAAAEGLDVRLYDVAEAALKLGVAYPRGPLEWADELGLDFVLQTVRTLQADYGDDRYRPAMRLRRLVQAGRLGLKAGRGFF